MRYPGDTPPSRDPDAPMPVDSNPPVRMVFETFARVRSLGDFIACRDGGDFPRHRYTRKNFSGNRSKIHFQGIQRSRTGKFLFISGDDFEEKTSQVFVLEVGSRSADGPWGSNLIFDRDPLSSDRLVETFALDNQLWHGGGMAVCGDILAVAVEDETRSDILFLDVSDPRAPTLFDVKITRGPTVGKAGAVALCKLANEHYLCAVWSDSDDNPKRFDFYLSRSTDFKEGFRRTRCTWEFAKLLPTGGRNSKYQAVNFIIDTDDQLFIIGSENTSPGAPLIAGDDFCDLLKVTFPDRTLGPDPVLQEPAITRVAEKRLERGTDHYNMAAGGGIYIDRATHELIVYSAFHWRVRDALHIAEFRAETPPDAEPVTNIRRAWIDLFEDAGFRGRRLSVYGQVDDPIPDYGRIRVQDEPLGDRVSSVRFQIPAGHTYTLFKDSRFRGRSLDLVGDGTVIELPDLAVLGFDEQVSSSRYKT